MKFSEVQVNEKFTLIGDSTVFTKVLYHRGSCCTPTYNATFVDNKVKTPVKLFNDDVKVELVKDD